MAILLITLGALGLIALLNIYHGWILSVIWNWFIPLLGGPTLSIPIAVGISCVVAMFVPTPPTPPDEDSEEKTKRLLAGLVKPLILLFIAWFFHLFA